MHLHCFTLFNLTVCVCGKALYCVQSRAPILSQWSRAKGLNDPHLTQTLPLCVHVHAGGRCHLVLRIMNVCLCGYTQKRQSDRGQSTCFVELCFCETTTEKENNKGTQWGFFNAHKRNKCFKHIRVDKDEVENSQKTRGTSSWTNILCYCVTLTNAKKNCCCLPFSSNNFHLNTDGKSICMISYLIAVKCSRC